MVLDLAGPLRSLVDADVRFVVIGGVAVAAHAAVRATEDVDLVPDPDSENIEALTAVNLTVTTRQGDLDVVQRLPGVHGSLPCLPRASRSSSSTSASGSARASTSSR